MTHDGHDDGHVQATIINSTTPQSNRAFFPSTLLFLLIEHR